MHLQPDRYWESFMTAIGLESLVTNPRFETMESRMENGSELVAALDLQFASKTFDEWDTLFRSGYDFIYAKVQTIDELAGDQQVIANNYITTFDHPTIGPVQMCNHPNIYSETPAGIFREAPELGQHTEELLIDELGYTWDDISVLRDAGVIL